MVSISIIVPVYNLEALFSRCIESVFAQTFKDYELIIVDDGSTDISGRMSDYYALLSGKILVVHKVNNGVSSARNTGMEIASGKYTCFVDSDDYILPDFLMSLFTAAESTNSDYVSQNIILTSENSESVIHRDTFEANFGCDKDRYDFIVKKVLQGQTSWEMWGRIFRSDIFKNNHLRVCESCGNYAEDLAFIITYIVYCKKCCHIDYTGYCYYQRDESMIFKSRDTFKLNSINEVSIYLHDFFYSNHLDHYLNDYPLFHFWIMKTEFSKIYNVDRKLIKNEAKKIKNYRWYKKNIKKCIFYFKRIAEVCSKNIAFEYCNLSYFSIHKKYRLYHLIDILYYKFSKI